MRQIAAKFVERLLIDDQKQLQLEVCMELQVQVRTDSDFLCKVLTGGKSWVYGYSTEMQHQSSDSIIILPPEVR